MIAARAFWGRYALILRTDDGVCVVRDPGGSVPVFRARMAGIDLVFSDTGLAFDLDIEGRAIDWRYVAGRLIDNRLMTPRTGLVGVSEIEPGAHVMLGTGLPRVRSVWSLAAVAARSADAALAGLTATEARARLRFVAADAIEMLGAAHARVGLRLSGGFDSAVVAALLARARGPEIACYNLATPGKEGDERAYAQAVADHVGAALHVHQLSGASVDLARSAAGGVDAWRMRAVRPPLWIANPERDDADRACMEGANATALFSGRGGDNVFFRCEHIAPAVDRVRALGWSRASLAYAFATARRTGRPAIEVLAEADGRRTTPPPALRVRPATTAKARALAASLHEPAAPAPLPPGKAWHVEILDDRLNYIDLTPEFDVIHPLVSQPVMEVCLETPSWILAAGERDRGLARAAFEHLLPPVLRARRGKGRTSGYLNALVWRNRHTIAGWLLDGHLAQAGLLDPDVVRRMIAGTAVGRAEGEAGDLVGWAGVELWLRAAVAAGAEL